MTACCHLVWKEKNFVNRHSSVRHCNYSTMAAEERSPSPGFPLLLVHYSSHWSRVWNIWFEDVCVGCYSCRIFPSLGSMNSTPPAPRSQVALNTPLYTLFRTRKKYIASAAWEFRVAGAELLCITSLLKKYMHNFYSYVYFDFWVSKLFQRYLGLTPAVAISNPTLKSQGDNRRFYNQWTNCYIIAPPVRYGIYSCCIYTYMHAIMDLAGTLLEHIALTRHQCFPFAILDALIAIYV